MTELAWFIIGANAALLWVLFMLFWHRPTQRRWLRELQRRLGEE